MKNGKSDLIWFIAMFVILILILAIAGSAWYLIYNSNMPDWLKWFLLIGTKKR